jgi:cytochrome c peroxidase
MTRVVFAERISILEASAAAGSTAEGRKLMHKKTSAAVLGLLAAAAMAPVLGGGRDDPKGTGVQFAADPSGVLGIVNLNGRTRTDGPCFQSLGTNGRSCSTCHVADQAMSFSAAGARERFEQTQGRDPLFATVDGANCPTAQRSNPAAHSLLLQSGLIRVALKLPANAQYTLSVVHDPYGCALVPDPKGGLPFVSVYRRPLPSTNLVFLSAVMFDGRETVTPLTDEQSFFANLIADLTHQATDATLGHAEAAQPPTAAQLSGIVAFEMGLFTAQAHDRRAGHLAAHQAQGGPFYLANLPYYPGINDSLGGDPSGNAFDATAMTLFAPWATLRDGDDDGDADHGDDQRREARRAIAAGEQLFNSAPLQITNVRGLNDNAALGKPQSFVGHCTSCHDTPNVGDHSLPLPLDIGTAHTPLPGMESDPAIGAALAQLSMPDLPVYLVSGCPNPFAPTEPESFYTSDPGKALITGQCSDFNRIKGPILRGIAARAPYFHNGSAASLRELVNFYDQRFSMQLTDEQKSELVAFLNSL